MQIDDDVAEFVHDAATKLGLQVVSLNQRYEAIDDLVTVVFLGGDPPADKLEKLEEAMTSLESQVIVVRQSTQE